ncbi:hypothetical protein J2S92_004051 [Arthrobacter bambusae]|nr:hypothetical protein [Arthrobacter bambusae]MDQ0237647.1 hypothetical protein [Arthrobacter bambusae]
MNTASREWAPDQGPVSFDEAQRPSDRHIPDSVAYAPDLFEHAIDQLRTVAPAHEELLDAWPQDTALDLQLGSARVPLRVDHPDPLAGYGDMVDIRLRTRDPAVMKNRETTVGRGVKPGPETFLSDRTPLPRFGALPLVTERNGKAAQPTPFPAEFLLIFGLAALVLTSRRRPGNSGLRRR